MSYRVVVREMRNVASGFPPYYKARPGRIVVKTEWRDDRRRALGDCCAALNRKFGPGSAVQVGRDDPAVTTRVAFDDPILGSRYSIEVQHEAIPAEQPELPL